jgi:hypothetical protein
MKFEKLEQRERSVRNHGKLETLTKEVGSLSASVQVEI